MVKEHLFRTVRVPWLALELLLAFLRYLPQLAPLQRRPETRAVWLQRCCTRMLRVFNIEVSTTGRVPKTGLLVCNHLSYLDILVIGATAPARFVSKSEVRRWPVFGLFARFAGTLFINRQSRRDAARLSSELRSALSQDGLIVLFPEGTSSNGQTVLPFKPALFSAIEGTSYFLSAGLIRYAVENGSADDVCYWGDMTLVPHMLKLLGKPKIFAQLAFTEVKSVATDRKEFARHLHSEVVRLHRLPHFA